MELTDQDKENILEFILKIISHISDKNYQRRIWIQGLGPECDDFGEACCNFFGDANSLLKNYKDFWLTDDQYKILKNFRDEFQKFADDNDFPELFIDTPEWTEITLMAKKVLEAFNYRG